MYVDPLFAHGNGYYIADSAGLVKDPVIIIVL